MLWNTTDMMMMMMMMMMLMMMMIIALFLLLLPLISHSYQATWESLDARPLPQWYDDGKFGIFLHWGVFSVPSYGSEWFWNAWRSGSPQHAEFINKTEGSRFSYQDYAQRFDASLFRPDEWAHLFGEAGAQYVVMTSKHHEGYCMWDSRSVPTTWNWNVMDVGPKRDLLGDLSKAVKKTSSPHTKKRIRFGVYHSMFEWYNLLYTRDQENSYETNEFTRLKTLPELYDLVEKYEPEIVWSDGAWDASSDWWLSKEFLAYLATNSSVKETVVWNDRWGNDALCKHGSFYTCDDRYQPNDLQPVKWENCFTVDKTSWGFNRNSTQYYSTKELVQTLVATVALNGNFLLNVGPAADGTIPAIFVDRLQGMGQWLQVNGEAIYGTRPWSVAQKVNDTVYYTTKGSTLYAITTKWFNQLVLPDPIPGPKTRIRMLGIEQNLDWFLSNTTNHLVVNVPSLTPDIIPCQHSWAFVLEQLENVDGISKSTLRGMTTTL